MTDGRHLTKTYWRVPGAGNDGLYPCDRTSPSCCSTPGSWPLGTRLYALAVMAAVRGFGAWRRYRRMRTGARPSLRSPVRRLGRAELIVGQAVWCTPIAVIIVTAPWSERIVPQVLFWYEPRPSARGPSQR
ncbi:hypothetical protein [Streptomyces sp. NPDC089795]|uniref:hypothetical protein n=1 Tax=Streptomyces sp. NPDC089795 TaxID=3155297 RepID=UPI00343E3740